MSMLQRLYICISRSVTIFPFELPIQVRSHCLFGTHNLIFLLSMSSPLSVEEANRMSIDIDFFIRAAIDPNVTVDTMGKVSDALLWCNFHPCLWSRMLGQLRGCANDVRGQAMIQQLVDHCSLEKLLFCLRMGFPIHATIQALFEKGCPENGHAFLDSVLHKIRESPHWDDKQLTLFVREHLKRCDKSITPPSSSVLGPSDTIEQQKHQYCYCRSSPYAKELSEKSAKDEKAM